ncbi:MAG: nuclease A inhibitor family protein [Byssovorax sp.]
MTPSAANGDAFLHALGELTEGLLYPSESDAPLTPFRAELPAGEPLTPERLLLSLGLPAGTPIETTTVDDVLGPFAVAEEGAGDEDRAEAERYRRIMDALSGLTDLQAYRVGKVDIDVYLLGRDASGAWIGLKTHAVET